MATFRTAAELPKNDTTNWMGLYLSDELDQNQKQNLNFAPLLGDFVDQSMNHVAAVTGHYIL